jgi:hypothetical protein
MTYQGSSEKGPPDLFPVISDPEEYGSDFASPTNPGPLVGGVRETSFCVSAFGPFEGAIRLTLITSRHRQGV